MFFKRNFLLSLYFPGGGADLQEGQEDYPPLYAPDFTEIIVMLAGFKKLTEIVKLSKIILKKEEIGFQII